MTQAFGYITWTLADQDNNWIKRFIIGGVFLLFAIYDHFYFRMYPAQENIFVEDIKSRRKEKQAFEEINTNLKLNGVHSNKNKSVFDL